jgi:hypothetical protein
MEAVLISIRRHISNLQDPSVKIMTSMSGFANTRTLNQRSRVYMHT